MDEIFSKSLQILRLFAIIVLIFIATVTMILVSTTIGIAIGFGYTAMNLWRSSKQAFLDYIAKAGYRDLSGKQQYSGRVANRRCESLVFEEISSPSFFFGPCYLVLKQLLQAFFQYAFQYRPNFKKIPKWYTTLFKRPSEWYFTALFIIQEVGTLISVYVFGTIFAVCLAGLIILAFAIIMGLTYLIISLALLFDRMYRKIRKVYFLCPECKERFPLPIYICPICGMQHNSLMPGKYGVLKRKCLCGMKMPLTVYMKGKEANQSSQNGRFSLHNLNSICPNPECSAHHRGGIAQPASIALIGGTAAGKTCLQASFLHNLIKVDAPKCGFQYEFTDQEMERKYQICEDIFSGHPIAPTQRGIKSDIFTISFFLSGRKLSVPRIIHSYDMAGEVFQTREAEEGWKLFETCRGAVLLIDPLTLENPNNAPNRVFGLDEIIESIIDTMHEWAKEKHGKCMVPIALTISKSDIDGLDQVIGDSVIKYLMNSAPLLFVDYYQTMDYVCRCYLSQHGGDTFIQNLENHFSTVRFFSCSAQGGVQLGQSFTPINVTPILRWIMVRGDKELDSAWSSEQPIPDLTEEQRRLYISNSDYYDSYISQHITPNA